METENVQTSIDKNFINTTYGQVCYRSIGCNKYPLFLIVHGSGVNNSSAVYESFLYEYLVMYHQIWKLYLVAIDCPGYGESTGLRSVIRAFPTKFLQEVIIQLTGKDSCLMMMGHSQGGYSIFNSLLQNPNLSNFLLQDRPVCGDIKRLKDFKIPTLLIYDEEDDGHPIRQGKLIVKMIKYSKFYSYKSSNQPYWVSDNLFGEILKFLFDYKDFFVHKNDLPNFELIQDYNGINFSNKKINSNAQKNAFDKIPDRNNSTEERISLIDNPNSKIKEKENNLENIKKRSRSLAKKESKLEIENKNKSLKDVIYEVELDEEEASCKKLLKFDRKIETPKDTNPKEDILKDLLDYKCPLCLEIFIKPIKLLCNHIFCFHCLEMSLIYNAVCPLCRQGNELDKVLNIKNVDKKIEDEIKNKFDPSVIEKRQIQIEEELKNDRNKMIKIEYGNTSIKMENNKSFKTRYNWEMYVKESSSPVANPIKFVEFNINTHLPNYKPIKVTFRPFKLEKTGTFEFVALIKVTFKDNLNIEPYSFHHRLSLGPEKKSRNFVVYLKK